MLRIVLALSLVSLAFCSVGGLHWCSWDAEQCSQPQSFLRPKSESEVVDIVKSVLARKGQIRVVGAGHSFSPVALTNDTMISLDNLNQISTVSRHIYPRSNPQFSLVTVGGGIRLRELNDKLLSLGLALENMGATTAQSIAGATATGTHGTGMALGSISTQIYGMKIVNGLGEMVEINEERDPEMMNAARVSIGALGIVVSVTLKVVDAFNMRLDTIPWDLDELMFNLPRLLERHPRVQWYWTPYTKNATVVIRTPTTDPITGCWTGDAVVFDDERAENNKNNKNNKNNNNIPLFGDVATSCVDVSFKTLSDSLDHYKMRSLYTEMEMFVPVEKTKDAVAAFRQFQESVARQHSPSVSLFTGVRYVAADSNMLSPQYNRTNAVISFIVSGDKTKSGNQQEFDMFAQGLEDVTINTFEGRPHWGKKNFVTEAEFASMYPKWNDFAAIRRKMDPHGIFLNEYLESLFGKN